MYLLVHKSTPVTEHAGGGPKTADLDRGYFVELAIAEESDKGRG
jgi:hypothetical protein